MERVRLVERLLGDELEVPAKEAFPLRVLWDLWLQHAKEEAEPTK